MSMSTLHVQEIRVFSGLLKHTAMLPLIYDGSIECSIRIGRACLRCD